MKRILIYIICLCLLLTGCNSSGSISTFTIAVNAMPQNFDPQIASSKEDLVVITNIFDGLFEKNGNEVNNNLAENYTVSPDGKTYTIKIKQGRNYHYNVSKDERKELFDNAPVTAMDFVFALQRVLSPETQSPYANAFMNIKNAANVYNGGNVSSLGVSATDDYTLVIKLENPDYNFIEKLCSTAAFPCNKAFFESTGGAYGLSIENILSNGPFRLNYLDLENGNATIVRTDDSKGMVDRIRLKQIDTDKQPEAYEDESIDGYFAYSNEDTNYSNTTVSQFNSSNICLVINSNNSFLSNGNMRKSLAWYAFGFKNSGANPQAVTPRTSIFPGAMTFAGEYINNSVPFLSPAYMGLDPIQLANDYSSIQEDDSLTLLIPSDSRYKVIFENINQLWQRDLGIFFKTEYITSDQINEKVALGDYDIAFLPLTPKDDTPYGVLEMFSSQDENLQTAVAQARATSNENEAIKAISTAQDIIIENAYVTPLGAENTVFYCRKYFKGVMVNPFNCVINLKRTTVS